nr:hypothetical protein [Tanacetum cinerariifolium]
KGENATNTATEEPPSHTEREIRDTTMVTLISSIHPTKVQSTHNQPINLIISHPESSHETLIIDKGKRIATESEEDPSKKLVPTSTIIHPDLDEPVRVEFMINEKIVYLLNKRFKIYRGTDGRNFDVHKPFLFGAFGIFELDELREIIQKKNNTVVKDLINSLSRMYERLRQIPRELGIRFALSAPEQAPSQTSGS